MTTLTPTEYVEERATSEPILQPDGRGWNGQAMHQLDPVLLEDGSWIAAVDGFGKYYVFGLDY